MYAYLCQTVGLNLDAAITFVSGSLPFVAPGLVLYSVTSLCLTEAIIVVHQWIVVSTLETKSLGFPTPRRAIPMHFEIQMSPRLSSIRARLRYTELDHICHHDVISIHSRFTCLFVGRGM